MALAYISGRKLNDTMHLLQTAPNQSYGIWKISMSDTSLTSWTKVDTLNQDPTTDKIQIDMYVTIYNRTTTGYKIAYQAQ